MLDYDSEIWKYSFPLLFAVKNTQEFNLQYRSKNFKAKKYMLLLQVQFSKMSM